MPELNERGPNERISLKVNGRLAGTVGLILMSRPGLPLLLLARATICVGVCVCLRVRARARVRACCARSLSRAILAEGQRAL